MSELNKSKGIRQSEIYTYLQILVGGHANKEHYQKFKPLIDTITRRETIAVVDQIMKSGMDIDMIKKGVNRFITGISSTILKYPLPEYADSSVLYLLSKENEQIKLRMTELKPIVQEMNKRTNGYVLQSAKISEKLKQMEKFSFHYTKLQNILFPAVESHWPDFRCTQLMWSYHDDVVSQLKDLKDIISSDGMDLASFNRVLGRFFFDVYAMMFREEHVLFPEINESLDSDTLTKLYDDCFEIGFSYITPSRSARTTPIMKNLSDGKAIHLSTGVLLPDQLSIMLNNLPCDVTYVDENDEVAFFSSPSDRIFPRSAAIIGRKVQNCHPPESVAAVQEIIDSFRDGDRDTADFWLALGDRKVLIRYFALRTSAGAYRGALEVTQDITGLQSLSGEKRLLDDT